MEKDLIRIETTAKGNKAVSGRELHKFLEVGKDFSTWMKDRIEKFNFVENSDYYKICFNKNGEQIQLPKNGESNNQAVTNVHKIEYVLTLDMAKELSMIENNEKGREARKYFIECEKRLNQQLPQNYKEALLQLVAQIEEKEKLQKELSVANDKIEHKKEVIIQLTSDTKLLTMRQFLNEIIRMKGNDSNLIRSRWKLLYSFYEKQKGINLHARLEGYNLTHKPKINKLEFIENVLRDLPTLYKVAVKTFEADFKDKVKHYLSIL